MIKPRSWLKPRRVSVEPRNSQGFLLVAVLGLTIVLSIIGIALLEAAGGQYQLASAGVYSNNAYLTAEAGIEESVHQLNLDDSFAGYPSAQQFFNNGTQGRATFETSITTAADGSKTIISTGDVYHNNDKSGRPYATRKIKVTMVGTSSTGYSVFSGPGGLTLNGVGAIVNSAIYTGGSITLTGAAQIGTLVTPLTVDVANNQCPQGSNPGATYPQVCTDGTQPISVGGMSHIYGTVCATGQTSTAGISGGLSGGSGLQPGCVAPKVSMPTYDRQAQIDAVATTGTGATGSYGCSNGVLGLGAAANWPANVKITGDVKIGGVCNLTINGNAYITGDLTIGASSHVTVANSVGTTRPVVIVDGTITVNGAASMAANSSGTGVEFISFKNSTGNPAATPTGTDLYNSSQQQTITVSGATILPGIVFDAYWGKISVGGANIIGSAIGQSVDLSGSASITFGTTLASGARTWTIRSYQEIY